MSRNLASVILRCACRRLRPTLLIFQPHKPIVRRVTLSIPPIVNYLTDYFKSEDEQNDFDNVLSKACTEMELKLEQFMDVLRISVFCLCNLYRENIDRQIKLMQQSGEIWSPEIEKLQAKNERLKASLYKYRILAATVGNMAYDQAINSLHLGSEDPKRIVCKVYCGFESFVKDEFHKNEECVKKLEQQKTQIVGDEEEVNQRTVLDDTTVYAENSTSR